MPMVDNEGRLFGKINLLDGILAILLLGLLPLAYGAYALFRTPEPRLIAVEPAVLTAGSTLRVTIRGENLRPYLRVTFGVTQGLTFLFQDPTRAVVELNPMDPGVYDAVLFDFGQERSRLPKALTIAPSPLPEAQLIVAGSFLSLRPEQAAQIAVGLTIPGTGRVLEIANPRPANMRVFSGASTVNLTEKDLVRIPAVLQVGCDVRAPTGRPDCYLGGFALQPTSLLRLDVPGLGPVHYQVDQVRGVEPLDTVTATITLTGFTAVLARIEVGDVDLGSSENELAAGGKVLRAAALQPLGGSASSRDVTLAIRSQRGPEGWTYGSGPLRVGAHFLLRTPLYEATGVVVDLKTAEARSTSRP